MGRGETIARCLGEPRRRRGDGLRPAATWPRSSKVIRRAYHRKVLATHPDKGGDAQEFRDVQSAFEVSASFMIEVASSPSVGSEENNQTSTSDVFQNAADYFAAKEARGDTQSYDYYAEAAEEDVPTYRVEPAK